YEEGYVDILWNDSKGGFTTRTAYELDSDLWSITAADLNNDALPELIVTRYSSGAVTVLLNHGGGSFERSTDYLSGSGGPCWATPFDIDEDGFLDLAVVDAYAHRLTVLRNSGDGSFRDKVEFTTGTGPSSSAAADFNGDSLTDIAVANWESDEVTIFINERSQ
ncbi:MAG: VCBS repeat-containing protein, partial [Dehalococcoidia bacterium]|nr:VCBS repeat-containing protein [Dehalococcoidia bacterium]